MASVAIMQPYLFPYIGYMNLVYASDKFVFYDDVNFINKGWINRNRIILMNKPFRFTLPLKAKTQTKLIKDIEILDLKDFTEKFISQIDISYKNSSNKNAVLTYIQNVLNSEKKYISDLAISSVKNFFKYIGVEKEFFISSKKFSSTKKLRGIERLVSISKKLNCENYLNLIGGLSLYKKEDFKTKDVQLKFVKPSLLPYKQPNLNSDNFYPSLSIIDVMMNQSADEIHNQLESYHLL